MPQYSSIINKNHTGKCKFCGGKATLLCDMPKEPLLVNISNIYTSTCDNEICEKCSIKFHGNDICIGCVREIRDIWNERVKKE